MKHMGMAELIKGEVGLGVTRKDIIRRVSSEREQRLQS